METIMSQVLEMPRCGIETMACASDLALVIVDMQPEYLACTSKKKRERIIDAHRQLIEVCARKDVPIAVLEMVGGDMRGEPTVPEVKGVLSLVPRVAYVPKREADGFWRTFLAHHLWNWQRCNTLLITGCLASGCVRATATSAFLRNFEIRLAEPLIADEEIDGIEMRTDKLYREHGWLRPPSIEALLGVD